MHTGWTPNAKAYKCACGCGQIVVWKGIGRKPMYVDDAHRKRYTRALERAVDS